MDSEFGFIIQRPQRKAVRIYVFLNTSCSSLRARRFGAWRLPPPPPSPPTSDFGNGYLVAEIFSRYYDKDLSMHSFHNGASLSCKRDNWGQLLRFFDKRGVAPGGVPVTRLEAEEIMVGEAKAVLTFVARIYEFLSGRRLPVGLLQATSSQMSSSNTNANALSYARPTASREASAAASAPSAPVDDRARAAQIAERIAELRRTERESRDASRGSVATAGGGGVWRLYGGKRDRHDGPCRQC